MLSDKEIVYANVSKVDRTADGKGFAFIKLDAAGKGMTSLDAISDYPHLRIIDVSKNGLTTLGKGLLGPTHLMTLVAAGNKLTSVDNTVFAKQKYLLYLDLSENEITKCETTNWVHLARFFLNTRGRTNKLTSVVLGELSKLQKLYLAQNQLTNLAFVKGKFGLETLHLRENLISSLKPFADSGLSKLTYLNLRNNKIDEFDEIDHLRPLKALIKLNLQENPVCEKESYRLNVVYRLPKLQVLDKEPINPDEREEGEQVRVQNERAREQERARQEAERAAAAGVNAAIEEAPEEGDAGANAGEAEGDGGAGEGNE
ncbi:hypothetical protein BCR44DRAFT_1494941 [Catenaria anguillulae PL171]|uniref:Leucine-rich repeat-domain-containing protein n=1 Tax=Catenaria anguillulae PL171 TaxID=765915 RepID=A0A1Y2I3I8_9FUNG|nr:hypothetical protein BCR44DRAFT_1494941 [Catenaria anguillulae PL171]